MTWTKFKKEELLKLPQREYGKTSSYNSVLFVNTRQKHDSGYNLFAIIGCRHGQPVEIVGYMDDFRFNCLPKVKDVKDTIMTSDIAFDSSMRGVFRMHSATRKICVGISGSTTEWWLE